MTAEINNVRYSDDQTESFLFYGEYSALLGYHNGEDHPFHSVHTTITHIPALHLVRSTMVLTATSASWTGGQIPMNHDHLHDTVLSPRKCFQTSRSTYICYSFVYQVTVLWWSHCALWLFMNPALNLNKTPIILVDYEGFDKSTPLSLYVSCDHSLEYSPRLSRPYRS